MGGRVVFGSNGSGTVFSLLLPLEITTPEPIRSPDFASAEPATASGE